MEYAVIDNKCLACISIKILQLNKGKAIQMQYYNNKRKHLRNRITDVLWSKYNLVSHLVEPCYDMVLSNASNVSENPGFKVMTIMESKKWRF